MASAAQATVIDLGYASFDVTVPGSSAQFDIQNVTGANQAALGDPAFPVKTQETFSDLSLVVDFSNGSKETFGSSYFTLSLDGFSFDGSPIAIGGVNPQPVSATLTGDFSTKAVTLASGAKVTLSSDAFSTTITDHAGDLQDGDFGYITATYGKTPPVPEPGSVALFGTALAMLAGLALWVRGRMPGRWKRPLLLGGAALAIVASIPSAGRAASAVGLTVAASPSTGTAGITYTNLTAANLPNDTILPPSVKIAIAPTCAAGASSPVAGEVDTVAYSVKPLPGSNSRRVQFLIPASVAKGTYLVSITGSTVAGATFASVGCSVLGVSNSPPPTLICLPTSSLAVALGSTVTAYVPNGAWEAGTTGIQVATIEGSGGPTAIATPQFVNSCSTNSATGQTICTANNTDVYLVNGRSLTATLTSGATGDAHYSGGNCANCGVAINALLNKAYISEGSNSSPNGSQLQSLDLGTKAFATPFLTQYQLSEDISIDPGRSLILSPSYGPSFDNPRYQLYQLSPTGAVTQEFTNPVFTPEADFPDSAAEDCTTGIALSSLEDQSLIYLADLTQATFSGSTWTAPGQKVSVALSGLTYSAGTTGISVAPGAAHLGIVTGEFGGNVFSALQLPSTSGTGTPTLTDYAGGALPATPDGNAFTAGYDPHTVTAYTSPNNGKAYGVIADWGTGVPTYLAIIDLKAMLAAPRLGGTNTVDPSYDLVANGVVRYVPVR